MDHKVRLNHNGKLRILQVSDAQDLHVARPAMLRMLSTAYDLINPDLVVLTGDNLLGNHLVDARFGNRKVVKTREGSYKRLKKSLDHILSPLEERNIPFAFIFGNHDDMNLFSKDEQADIYTSYSCCISPYGADDKTQCGTYNIPVYSHDGERLVYNLWMIDSAGHDSEGKNGYDHVSGETVRWYIEKSEKLKAQNGGVPLPSIMFQHIPFPEAVQLLTECEEDEKGCVIHEERYFRLDPKRARGTLGEYPSVCRENFGQFEALKKQGDVKAVVFGHDHTNCFSGRIDGIDIIQTPCASFRCYGNDERGVRLFELDTDSDGGVYYATKNITYFDIFGKGLSATLRYIWDADERTRQKYILLTAAGAVSSGVTALYLIHKRKKIRETAE